MKRSAESQTVADLRIGARGRLEHHSAHGEAIVPIFIDRGAPARLLGGLFGADSRES